MKGQSFLRIIEEAFCPFMLQMGFLMETPSISGRYYRVNFKRKSHKVSITYEPGDNELFVLVFGYVDGNLTDIDDRTKTPRLSDLNSRFMQSISKDERIKNENIFKFIKTNDNEERKLLKAAKELCIVLPKYLD